ncbi:MAG TPA: phosphomannomutase/phosphoglucomutase [Actinomycetota bacterium]|nr:phosphomannomutase/phosphoglucomutase [Actinomycetota bacterium]
MDLDPIFKAYDIRGLYPEQIDADAARRIGRAFAVFTASPEVLVGRDMRESSPELAAAFIEGVTAAGSDAVDLGLCSTDLVYYASGHLGRPGAMFTASHNPAVYNGIKMCGPGAAPIGIDTGLLEIKALATDLPPEAPRRGSVSQRDLLDEFADHLLSRIALDEMKPLVVAVDAANGMGGKVVPAVLGRLPIEVVPLYFELDGTFPNHPADPIQPENLRDLQGLVRSRGADVGLAFDGDADRVFLLDEHARPVSGSLTTALVTQAILTDHPGETVIYNAICSRVVPEVIEELGGRGVRSKVGHSFIKQLMAEHEAVFGGEHSGHYYFRDNYRADSGLLASLYVLDTISRSGRTLGELLAPLDRYSNSGEINSVVTDQTAALEAVSAGFAEAAQDRLDGLTVSDADWWFNVRPSNTEPLLRLNVEATSEGLMAEVRDRVLSIIR